MHFVHTGQASLLVLAESWADTVPHPGILAIGKPMKAIVEFLDAGNHKLPLGGRLVRPKVSGIKRQVDVVVTRDYLVSNNSRHISFAESQLRGGMKFAVDFNLVKLKPQQMTVDMKLVSR